MKANQRTKMRLPRIANKLVSVITLIFFSAGTVFALPAGQQVVNGQANFTTQGNNLTITNSPNAIINWQGFSINHNEAVRFIQQYGSSAVLNRVIGQDPSRILGLLQSNGRVFLINPNGILFGQGARIDVNGLFASTLNISNQDFLAGKYNFTAGAVAGSIQNQGTITTPEGGKVYLIAPDIENSGLIHSPKGDVILAAGYSVQLVDSLDPDISIVVSAPENKSVNLGQIVARSGKVGIYGGLISQRGIIHADSAVVGENGRIFFKAKKDVTLDQGSVTSAQGGGTIEILGGMDSGTVTVNGVLDASAPNGGDGGFIETSAAKVSIGDNAAITTLAPYGKTGTWLIDPTNYTIAATGGDISGAVLGTQLNSANVTIRTADAGAQAGDITVDDSVNWGNTNTLTLKAHNDIKVNQSLTATMGGKLVLRADSDADGAGNVTFGGSGHVYMSPGYGSYASIFYNPPGGYTAPTNYSSYFTAVTPTAYMLVNNVNNLQAMNTNLAGTYALGKGIDAGETSGWNNGAGFVPVGTFTGVFDGLGYTISNLYINRPTTDQVGLFGYTNGATIQNVGLVSENVTGRNTVGGLVGQQAATGGVSSIIANSFSSGTVTGTSEIGGLAGRSDAIDGGTATITDSYSSANVTGQFRIGGLAGVQHANGGSSSTIANSYSAGTVTGNQGGWDAGIGGLAGFQEAFGGTATITNSYHSTGLVQNLGNGSVGGLVGLQNTTSNTATITNSYNTAGVTGANYVGGLVGESFGTISNSYSAGTVTGTALYVGGLVGDKGDGSIVNSYSTGAVSGTDYVGGLVGWNRSSSSITNSYSTGMVSGSGSLVGGLLGANNGIVANSYWDTVTSGQATSAEGTGLTTTEMMTQATFTGEVPNWDFVNTWWMSDTNTRPFLRSEYSTHITNAHQLQLALLDLSASYSLANNIDMGELTRPSGSWNTATGFVPLGDSSFIPAQTFTGTFDGLGHTITGLYINRPATQYVGTFGGTSGTATIRNLGLVNINITGGFQTGGLVAHTGASVMNCYTTGQVTSGSNNVGGLVGLSAGSVSDSYSTATVNGNTWVGGLVGTLYTGGSITNSYSTGAVNGTSSVGGLVGWNFGQDPIVNSYWDTQTSGRATSDGGTGLTTAQMKTQSSFSGWDFTNTWGIVEGSSYPYLKWQPAPAPQQVISGMLDVPLAGKIIYFVVDGTLLPDQTSTIAGGLYSIALSGNPVPSNSALLVYVYNDTVKGASVYLSSGGNITNLFIESNALTASSGGGTVSNTTLGTAKGSLISGDIPYSVLGTDLTLSPNFNFKTASGTTYSINGNITTTNGSQTYNGPVTLVSNAALRNTGTGGNISFGGPVTGTGYNFTFDAGATHDITLTNVGNNFSGVGITSGNNVSLVNAGALALNASTVSGALDVTAGGHITQTGALAVNNNATLYAQGTASDLVINGSISKTGGSDTTLLLKADNAIIVNSGAAIGPDAAASGKLNVALNATGNIGLNGDVLATGGIEIHAGGDVTQNAGNIANTLAGSTTPGSYDINISGQNVKLSSVASQRDIDVTAQSLTVGNIQALGSQGFHVDDEYFEYLLPFSFSFYDTPYSTAYISSNGIITFGSGTSAYTDSTSYLQDYKIIASAWNDWDTRDNPYIPNLDVYVSPAPGALAVRWNVARYPVTSQSAQFETVLYNNGSIKFNYGPANTSFAGDVTIGLSNQSSASTLVSQLMGQPNFSMNNLRSTTFSYASGQYGETLSEGSDWNATMPGAGTSGITSMGNISLNSASGIAINGIVNAGGNNLKLAGTGIVSQRAPITAAGLELLGAGATYNLTNTGNAITTLAGNTGTVNFTNSTGIGIGTVNTAGLATSGDLTLNSGGAITQTARLQVGGAATLDAGATHDITLMNAGNNFSSVGITSGKDVSLRNAGALALNASTVNNSLSATAGGDITLNGLVDAGTGSVTLSSGGAIINGMGGSTSLSAGSLFADAVNGIGSGDPLMTGVNNLTALNTTANHIEIDNTGVLTVSGLRNLGTGDVILQNIGNITTDASTVTSSGGAVSITAHSPLTIGSGGVSASGDISLEAAPSGGSDDLTINGNIASANGNIILSAGSGIVLGPEIALSAPNGTITLRDGLNGSSTDTGDLADAVKKTATDSGNDAATQNTVSSLMTAVAKIASDEKGDDENERKKKTSAGGEKTTDDKKTDDSVKKYCN